MQTESIGTATLETWTPDEVATAFAAHDIVLIDVRTIQEYAYEHIEGALLLPMAEFEGKHLPDQSGKRLVFYCGSGIRSARMAKVAIEAGFDSIAHLGGGFAAWKVARHPYITIDMPTGAPRKVAP
ncbi:MAG: rhodanese-like domain-containing protein [Pseudomonadota bacterium]